MKRVWRSVAALACCLPLLASASELDGLLDSLADSCQASPALVSLLKSLGHAEGEPRQVVQPAQLSVPPALAASFGTPERVAVNDDIWLLGVPAQASWHGVPVTALTRLLSLHEAGGEFAIELNGRPAEVEAGLRKALSFRHSKVAVGDSWQTRGASFVVGVNGETSTAVVCPLPF